MNPLISIIMPAYNAASTITQAIDSVLTQTYDNWELIIINDKSSDSTLEIIENYCKNNNKIILINKIHNEGVASARNSGIDIAKGSYIAFLDSDDFWLSCKLQKQVDILKKYNVDVVFGSYYRFNDAGLKHLVNVPYGYLGLNDLLKGNFIGNLTGLYNFSKYKNIRQKKVGAEDYLFWLEIFSQKNTFAIGVLEPIAYYRVASNATSLSSNKLKSASWTWKIYYNHLNLGVVKSMYYFANYVIRAFRKRI